MLLPNGSVIISKEGEGGADESYSDDASLEQELMSIAARFSEADGQR